MITAQFLGWGVCACASPVLNRTTETTQNGRHFLFEMDPSFFEQAALELDADAKDFQRAVDTQLSIFVREKELHERTMQELNRS